MPRRHKASSCPCCGDAVGVRRGVVTSPFCSNCRGHVADAIDGERLAPDERTYSAQYGRPCPFAAAKELIAG